MTVTATQLNRKIEEAKELQSVVRAMKAIAAVNMKQYEQAVDSLTNYDDSVKQGLGVCLKKPHLSDFLKRDIPSAKTRSVCVIVFGTDQGLVGRFNDDVVDYAARMIRALPQDPIIWAVGQRTHSRLCDEGLSPIHQFDTPTGVEDISQLVSDILNSILNLMQEIENIELHLIYNKAATDSKYVTSKVQLLPFDKRKLNSLIEQPWPTQKQPEILGDELKTFRALIREYLFVSLYRTCGESLSGENLTRLHAMERAEKNIDELLENLQRKSHAVRQSTIDAELFDLIAGFESK